MYRQNNTLVIGSSGYLGRCITQMLGANVVIPTHCTTPLFPDSLRYNFFTDDVNSVVDTSTIATIIFAAMVEFEPTAKVQEGIERFVKGCKDKRLIYLSSDGIFDGERGNYSEEDLPAPNTLYGRNLLLCEQLMAECCLNHCIIRPSYIYGYSNGQLDKRLATTRAALEAGQEVKLFDDMYKSPLGVKQVAQAVINLSASNYRGILHVAGERLSIFDFHRQAMRAMGVETDRLTSHPMPTNGEFVRDVSLNFSRWQTLTGGKPLSVKETLSNG